MMKNPLTKASASIIFVKHVELMCLGNFFFFGLFNHMGDVE